MNSCRGIAGMLVTVMAFGALAHAADNKPLNRSESLELMATVESVDQATRTVVLHGDSGARVEFVAAPEVRNLAQVKAGDRVRVTYLIAIAAQVKPAGTPLSAPVEGMSTQRAPPGKRPAAAAGHSVVTTVKVDSIDTSFNTVTFKRADGITRTVGVEDPEAQRFIRTLKPGDSVEISYSEALAVSVEPVAH